MKIITSGKNEYPYEGRAIMTRGDLVVIAPVPDGLIVSKTGAVQNHFMLSAFSKENRISQLEMRESTNG